MPDTDAIIRKSISFPADLEGEISKQATKNNRSFSAQVVHEMRIVMERAKRRRFVVAQPPVSHRPMRLNRESDEK